MRRRRATPSRASPARPTQWGTGSSMAAGASRPRHASGRPNWTRSGPWARWRRCTTPPPRPGSRRRTTRSPGVPQVACFDTAFHHTLPPAATTYALPAAWRERWGLRRYGFHGINVEWCTRQAFDRLGADGARRLVVCHLGSGCSVTAVHEGRSVDTTMGWTPLEGVPMATRAGSIDPGILLRVAAELPTAKLDDALNRQAGLLALAPGNADLRELFDAAGDGEPDARRAADVFVHHVAAAVAAMLAALGGLDAVVFTAGLGENSVLVRNEVTARIRHLGDHVAVLVVPAGDKRLIAQQTAALPGRAEPRGAAADRRLVAGRQLPVGRPDLPARQPAAARAAAPRAHQAAPARALGHHARPELRLRPSQPAHPRPRPERDLRRRPRPRRARRWWPTPSWRAPTASSIPHIGRDADGMRRLFRQFSFPGGIPSHVAPETPGSIHEGGELGYVAGARLRRGASTIPTCSSSASSATARPRPVRWPPAGTPTSSSTRRATARCCRSCT